MGVSKHKGTPKWMVKIMVPNPMNKWMKIGGFSIPLFLVGNTYILQGETNHSYQGS